MATKTTQSSGSTLLIILLVLITFPFWIGLFGLAVGILGGVFGAMFGIIGGVFGAIGSLIAMPFKMLFGHGHWFPHINGYVIAVLVIVVLLVRQKSKST